MTEPAPVYHTPAPGDDAKRPNVRGPYIDRSADRRTSDETEPDKWATSTVTTPLRDGASADDAWRTAVLSAVRSLTQMRDGIQPGDLLRLSGSMQADMYLLEVTARVDVVRPNGDAA